jgi:CubicO group peptidase (beta-lactamase class C family)
VRTISAFLAAATAFSSLVAQGQRPAAGDIARAVDSLATRIVASGVTPGLGVAVVMDGRTILAKGYGWADAGAKIAADERTYWYVASTSKSYTGFGVALLVNQRVISLATPITTLLPGVRVEIIDDGKQTNFHFNGAAPAQSVDLGDIRFVRR